MTKIKKIIFWILGIGIASAAGTTLLPNHSFENLPNVAKEAGLYRMTVDEYTEVEIPETTKPEVKLKKWGDETFVRVWYDDIEASNSKQENGKLKWKGSKKEAHLYEVEEGFEFEVILKEKPASNVIILGIESKGLNFYYQLPLDIEMQNYDCWTATCTPTDCCDSHRPENVGGSYAV